MYVHFYSAIAKYEQMIIVSSVLSKIHSKVSGTGDLSTLDVTFQPVKTILQRFCFLNNIYYDSKVF